MNTFPSVTEYRADTLIGDGGYCDVYSVFGRDDLVFKSFSSPRMASSAWARQVSLSRFNLAPLVYSDVISIPFQDELLDETETGVGYVCERVDTISTIDSMTKKQREKLYADIQDLVDLIYRKTGWKFWDSHEFNVGYVKVGRKKHLVCLDTGNETFDSDFNAWGFAEPGPRCCYCDRFSCVCS